MQQLNIKQRWHEIKRALLLVIESSPRWTLYNAILITIKGVMPLIFIYLIKLFVDTSALLISNKNRSEDLKPLIIYLCLAGIVFMINSLAGSLGKYIKERHSFYVQDNIKKKIHNKTIKMNFSNFENFHFQDIHHRAISESSYRPSRIFNELVSLFQSGITLLLVAIILVTLHWSISLIVALLSVPIIVIRLKSSRRMYLLRRNQTADERKVGYYDTLLTDKTFAKEVRLFNLSNLFEDRYRQTTNNLREKQLNTIWISAKSETIIQLISAVALFGIYGLILFFTYEGRITQGEMVLYFLVLQRGYSVLQDFLSKIANLYDDTLYLKDLFEFFDYEVIIEQDKRELEFPSPIKEGITFKNVSFKYPHSSRNVFKNFNLTIKSGETLAIVGANGAGKTTLIKLLCGLYTPTSGKILIDNTNISEIKKESISKNVSAIFQDFTLYNVSARENIWFGDVTKNGDIKEIRESAKVAGVDTLLTNLPKGYENKLGYLFEGSEMLSQGEWQRIALARSIYHNSELIILDEPTSSLDAYTEANLIHHFKSITTNRTAIVISHRLTTIQIADRILMIGENGKCELGTHEELFALKGEYYSMVKTLENPLN